MTLRIPYIALGVAGLSALIGFFSFALFANAAPEDWKPLLTGVNREFSDISCPEPRTCYLVSGLARVGGTGGILKTSDGGESFASQNIPTSNPLHAVSCPSASVCFAAGDFGTFLKTSDGGATWTLSSLGSKANPPEITDLYTIDETRVFAVGKDAFIQRSLDGGASWAPPTLRTFADFYSVHFLDAQTGFIAGNDGALLRTADGGENWKPRGNLSSAGTVRAIRGNAAGLYAVGNSLQKSADAGETWIQQGKLAEEYRSAAVSPDGSVYLLAVPQGIFKTNDGGITWSPDFGTTTNAFLRSIICPASGYCIVVGSSGKAYRLGTPPPPPPPPAPVETVSTTASTTPLATAPARSKAELEAELEKALALAAALMAKTNSSGSPAPAEPLPPSVAQETIFTRNLKKGARGDDVKKLQELLAGVGGIYPEKTVNGNYGPATSRAVGKFQEKYGIVREGEKGYGEAGPKTRAKLIEAARGGAEIQAVAPAKPAVSTSAFTRTLKKGSKGDDVKKLQELLSADAEVYPEGHVNGVYGPATAKAIGRFQEKNGIAGPGDVGYAEMGPKTRAKLLELAQ